MEFKITNKLEILPEGLYACGEHCQYNPPENKDLDMWNYIGLALYDMNKFTSNLELVAECSISMERSISKTSATLNIFVRQDRRKSGYGTAILNEALKHCKILACQAVQLQIRKSNEASIKMAKKVGFKRAGYYPNNFDGENLICYLSYRKFFKKIKFA